MNELRPNEKVIQSYVYYKDKAFFVSTIERDYSAMAGVVRGEETIVWEIDKETKKRGDLLFEASGVSDHLEICKQLTRKGEYKMQNT